MKLPYRTMLIVALLVALFASSLLAIESDGWSSKTLPDNSARVTVVFSNDVHGGIMASEAEFLNPEFPPTLGGGASAWNIIQALKKRASRDGQYFLMADAGDIYQGAPIGSLTGGRAIVDYYNLIGMEAVTIGNHDLDQGYWIFDTLVARSKFPWIAANLKQKGTGLQYPGTKPWIIKEYGGLKVGIIGMTTTATKYMSFPKNVATIEFEDEVPALQRAIKEVRAAGAQSVWVIFHHGIQFDEEENYRNLLKKEQTTGFTRQSVSDAQELVHRVPGIDVLFAGHIHVGKPIGWVHPRNHTLLLQNYGHGGNLGAVDIVLDKKTGHVLEYRYPGSQSMLLLLQQEQWGRDPEMDKRISAIVDTVERGMDEVIGEALSEMVRGDGNSPMVSFVSDAMRDYGKSDVAFQNSGGVRENIVTGPITRRTIFHVEPFGNELVRFTVTGAFLKDLLEGRASSNRLSMGISGLTVEFDGSQAEGSRISKLVLNDGRMVHPDSNYTVTTTDYLLMGNSGMQKLTAISQEKVDWLGVRLSDAISTYIEKTTPIQPRASTRWLDQAKQP